MPDLAERRYLAELANRDAAKARLDGEIARIRGDLEERGIGGRIADEASAKAFAVLDEAAEFANESKGIIGGVVALILMWLFRRPILDAFEDLTGIDTDTKGHENHGYW